MPQFEELAKGYTELQQKFSSTRPSAPKSADEYVFEAKDIELDPELASAFKTEAHKAGLSIDQYKFVMGKYAEQISASMPTAEKAEAALKGEWGDKYDSNLAAANKAWKAYAGDIQDIAVMNNPTVIKLLAKIGAEIGEDTSSQAPAAADPGINESEVRDLMMKPDYWSRKDYQAKVDAYLQRGGKL
jgi:hypothetical protein